MSGCCRCGFCCRLCLFLNFCFLVKIFNVWNDVIEIPKRCDHPALPPNETGLEVLVAGLAKSGTRTICHGLNSIGVRAYHSEDFHFFSMWDWNERMWAKRTFNHSTQWSMGALVQGAQEGNEDLAEAVSKCRVKGIALDGIEPFFDPLYNLSPNVKVILLNWRSYEQYVKSAQIFGPKLIVMCFFCAYTASSLQVIPWGAMLRLLDPLVGSPIETVIRDGGPPICEVNGPMVYMYHQMTNTRRQYAAWLIAPITNLIVENAEQYDAWHAEVKRKVPPERLMEWSHTKNTFEDLCKFMGVKNCPRSGRLPRAINTWIFELDFPVVNIIVVSVRFFLHWVNWRLFHGACRLLCRACGRGGKAPGKAD